MILFFWHLISFDKSNTKNRFSSTTNTYDQCCERENFRIHMVFVWGCSSFLTVLLVILDFFKLFRDELLPGVGVQTCFLQSTKIFHSDNFFFQLQVPYIRVWFIFSVFHQYNFDSIAWISRWINETIICLNISLKNPLRNFNWENRCVFSEVLVFETKPLWTLWNKTIT